MLDLYPRYHYHADASPTAPQLRGARACRLRDLPSEVLLGNAQVTETAIWAAWDVRRLHNAVLARLPREGSDEQPEPMPKRRKNASSCMSTVIVKLTRGWQRDPRAS